MKIKVEIPSRIDINEAIKLIGYASEDIINFRVFDTNEVLIELKDGAEVNSILNAIQLLFQKYVPLDEKMDAVFENIRRNPLYHDKNNILNSDMVRVVENGSVSFKKEAEILFEYFSKVFLDIAKEVGCEKRKYPVLLPLITYKRTGYLKKSPQYAIFCCDLIENINKIKDIDTETAISNYIKAPSAALTPSACFHVYNEIEDKDLLEPLSITLIQDVFRNEGRFNWDEYGRLKCYTIRELVFVGDNKYVEDKISLVENKIESLLKELDLDSKIVISSDAFIIPEFQKLKEIQRATKSKYEIRIGTSDNTDLACASLNYHGVSFSKSFNFKVLGINTTVSGCIGFGIERWVLAFLTQYGFDTDLWPMKIKDFMKDGK